MNNPDQKFIEFLNFTSSQKEISLGIAKDETELRKLQNILIKNNFKKSNDIFELMSLIKNPHKNYLVLDKNFDKNIYDFLIQYPTGQIEIFNSEKMKSEISSLDYRNSAIIFLVTRENLSYIQKKEFDILPNIGLTYQD
ncbi:MAG: hypothetical protein M1338_04845 [Patescibacteria group bacterium]|nr:hypothetical protein [Patescibacteria group bacterium]